MTRVRRFGFGAVLRRFRGISLVAGFGAEGAVAFWGGGGFGPGGDFPEGGGLLCGGFGAATR